jgi:hypothetical protein
MQADGGEMEPEAVFLNVYGAPELIPRNEFRHLCSLAGRYDKPIPPRFLAPIDFLKIPAQFKRRGYKRWIISIILVPY